MYYGSRLSLVQGSEGPKYDPYHYDEWTVTRVHDNTSMVIVLHTGLVEWVSLNGVKDTSGASPYEVFTAGTNIPCHLLEEIYYRMRHTCRACGCKKTHTESGFPGESFNVCDRCGDIVSHNFHESEII